ncbi:MAG: type II secretion system secretin GspD [Myxococcales bacterium]
MRTTALLLVCALIIPASALAQETQNVQAQQETTPPARRRQQRPVTTPTRPIQRPAQPVPVPQRSPPDPNRPSIAPQQSTVVQKAPTRPSRSTPPPTVAPIDHKEAAKRANAIQLNFDKKDLTEIIQFVSQVTGRNFILPERVSGKITLLSNTPIPPDEVWNVFLAALDANNWALYPVGHYWKLSEKKQSARANIPTFLEPGQDIPPTEQMVTKLFKLRYVEADQMRNTLNQFTSRDSDFQIFPPDTLIISDLGLNMRRLEKLIGSLDQPGGSEEIHIVQVQYASAQTLQQKLQEIFSSQGGGAGRPAGRAFGIAEGGQVAPAPVAPGVGGAPAAGGGGPVQVSKIIAEERTNKLIIIAGGRSFGRVVELIRQLDVPTGGGGVQVYFLQNAKAEDIASTLQSLAQGTTSRTGGGRAGPGGAPLPVPVVGGGGAGGGGAAATADLFSGEVKITADKTTNSLVVIASASDYRNLVKVIEKLDIPRREVLVEAVIMEVNLDNQLDLGVSAHGGTVINDVSFQGAKGQAPLVVGSELGGLNSLGGVASLGSLGGFLAGLQGPPITVPGLNISLPSFAILVNALQSSSDVNVISTPHVTMVDNTEGEITVGQNVPFQAGFSPQLSGLSTGGAGTAAGAAVGSTVGLGGLGSLFAPIQRQNVELRLRIKPQISASDQVRLEVDEQTEEIASVDKTLGPTTSKRSAKTTVVVKDQETVVLGGLIQERTLKDVKKIPLLGSMPLIGWLFRNETTRKTRTNLLLFLTPYIIRDQSDYRRIFERKMAERAEFVRRFYGEETAYVANIDYERKAGPLTRMRRGIETERSKFENGGSGLNDERLILPQEGNGPPGVPSADARKQPAPASQKPSETAAPAPAAEEPVKAAKKPKGRKLRHKKASAPAQAPAERAAPSQAASEPPPLPAKSAAPTQPPAEQPAPPQPAPEPAAPSQPPPEQLSPEQGA